MPDKQFNQYLNQLLEVSDGYSDNDFAQEILEDYSDSLDVLDCLYGNDGQALLDEADYYNNLFFDSISFCQGEY